MSLDNLKLPAGIVTQLYKESLVDLNSSKQQLKQLTENRFNILGNNQKNILLIVNDSSSLHLNDADFQFLTGILNACKLSMADIGLLNIFHYKETGLEEFKEAFSPKYVIVFDVKEKQLQIQNPFVDYTILKNKNTQILPAPSLQFISQNTDEKKKLWAALKNLFNL